MVILHSGVAATQVRRGVGAPGAHNHPCLPARTHNINALLTSFPHLLIFLSVRVSDSFTRSRVQILVDVFDPHTGLLLAPQVLRQ